MPCPAAVADNPGPLIGSGTAMCNRWFVSYGGKETLMGGNSADLRLVSLSWKKALMPAAADAPWHLYRSSICEVKCGEGYSPQANAHHRC